MFVLQSSAVSKALRDYFSCTEAEEREERLGFQPVLDLIKQYGSWNITDPNWGDSKWELMPNLVNVHRNISITALFIPFVREDLRNSSNNIMNVRFPIWTSLEQLYRNSSTVVPKLFLPSHPWCNDLSPSHPKIINVNFVQWTFYDYNAILGLWTRILD